MKPVTETAISGEKFYGDMAIIVGSVFVLWGFLTSFLSKAWRRRLQAGGALLLAGGAVLSETAEVRSYTGKHSIAALLSLLVLLLIAACLMDVVLPTVVMQIKSYVAKVKRKQAAGPNLHKGRAADRNTNGQDEKPHDDEQGTDSVISPARVLVLKDDLDNLEEESGP